jgi:hypothetical protein
MPCIQTPRVSTKTETGAKKGWHAPAEEGLAHGEVALLLGLNARTEVGADLGRADFERVRELVAEEERMSATCDMGGAGGRATDRPNAVLLRPMTRSALKMAEMGVRGHRLPVRELDYSEAAPVENVRRAGRCERLWTQGMVCGRPRAGSAPVPLPRRAERAGGVGADLGGASIIKQLQTCKPCSVGAGSATDVTPGP